MDILAPKERTSEELQHWTWIDWNLGLIMFNDVDDPVVCMKASCSNMSVDPSLPTLLVIRTMLHLDHA